MLQAPPHIQATQVQAPTPLAKAPNAPPPTVAIQRLTALWAFNEAGLGGLLHLWQVPFKGVLLAGFAVLYIKLLAQYSPTPGRTIIKALLVVLIIKAAVSPHSPITAYVAVSFQGLLGALLFQYSRFTAVNTYLLAVLALAESAMQRLLTLTLLFGQSLWQALGQWLNMALQALGQSPGNTPTQMGYALAATYVGIYIVAGIAVGALAQWLPKALAQTQASMGATKSTLALATAPLSGSTAPGTTAPGTTPPLITQAPAPITPIPPNATPLKHLKKRFGWLLLLLPIVAGALILLPQGGNASTGQALLFLLLRVVGVLLLWYGLVAPALLYVLKRFLAGRRQQLAQEVNAALHLLPQLRQHAALAWQEAGQLANTQNQLPPNPKIIHNKPRPRKGLARLKHFLLLFLARSLWH